MPKINLYKPVGIIVVVFIILIPIFSLFKEDPIDITASFGCIGGSSCFVGEILKLNVKINSNEETLTNQNKSISVISTAIQGEQIVNTTIIGADTQLSIPLKLSLEEGKYKIKITSDLVNVGGFFDKVLLSIKYLFYEIFDIKYSYTQEIIVRYPVVKSTSVNYVCTDKGFYFEAIKLKLEDNNLQELNCKMRIYTNKLVSTSHSLLSESPLSAQLHYYDSNFTNINKKDLSGSIQKVSFFADPAVQQIDTKIVPVCLIENNEIEVKKYEERLLRCKVNKKSFWS
ncbi:hypothetical protein HZA96_00310 [Candidatus Woesearchaeota archaeon]|nr:hypothetical protein [Candidatus Woesearchaeota archaeon]